MNSIFMKKLLGVLALFVILNSCKEQQVIALAEGVWLAELSVMDNQILPFNFKLSKNTYGKLEMEVYNAEEIITVDEIEIVNDSITIKFPVYEGYIAGRFTENAIYGEFIKESLDRIVPFKATHGIVDRFGNSSPSTKDISGVWETDFDYNNLEVYKGKGTFVQNGNMVTGTFRTETGDYRYLEGSVSGDSLKLSAFDGAHAFLFTAKVNDSSMNGVFYSGNHYKEPFIAKRNNSFELVSSDSLTFIKKGFGTFAFSFPNTANKMVSLEDERFKDKVVVVQIMGSWCPNCLDETKYYVQYLKENVDTDLEIVALAFEYAKTKEGAFKSIERLKDRIEVEYPILLAQFGSSDKDLAQEKLPMLNHVLSYPTSIFIDKKGNVRKIHTGFNGPATGEKFVEFKKEFDEYIKKLSAEK